MEAVPDWVSENGIVVGWEGGTNSVRTLHQQLLSNNISVAGYWLQDWSGLRVDPFGKRLWWNWELDEEWYPNWDQLLQDIAPATLNTYMNPYLANTVSKNKKNFRRDLFKEAASLHYLVQNSTGDPYIQSSASRSFTFGTIDLTNPNARQWTRNLIRCNMLGDQAGCPPNTTAIKGPQSGFMSDFGEYLPWDAVLSSGEPASTVHNAFPGLWSETCREAIKEAKLEGEAKDANQWFSIHHDEYCVYCCTTPGKCVCFLCTDHQT
jgi:alpha-glucosidase